MGKFCRLFLALRLIESKANGRELGLLLFLFHVSQCFTGAR